MPDQKVQLKHLSVSSHGRTISVGGEVYVADEETNLLHLEVDGKVSAASGVSPKAADTLLRVSSSLFQMVKPEPPKSKKTKTRRTLKKEE